jgi:hypothetical protein
MAMLVEVYEDGAGCIEAIVAWESGVDCMEAIVGTLTCN